MTTDGNFSTKNIWAATIFSYLGYDLARIEILDSRTLSWSFHIDRETANSLLADYDGGTLALSDAKAFVHHFNMLVVQKRELNTRGATVWEPEDIAVSPQAESSRPESFWEDARKAVEQRRREREEYEQRRKQPICGRRR